jgi:hypothetical protein
MVLQSGMAHMSYFIAIGKKVGQLMRVAVGSSNANFECLQFRSKLKRVSWAKDTADSLTPVSYRGFKRTWLNARIFGSHRVAAAPNSAGRDVTVAAQ